MVRVSASLCSRINVSRKNYNTHYDLKKFSPWDDGCHVQLMKQYVHYQETKKCNGFGTVYDNTDSVQSDSKINSIKFGINSDGYFYDNKVDKFDNFKRNVNQMH